MGSLQEWTAFLFFQLPEDVSNSLTHSIEWEEVLLLCTQQGDWVHWLPRGNTPRSCKVMQGLADRPG